MPTLDEWKARVGARIKELRQLKGMTQPELAEATGDRLGKSQISNYEQGTRLPGPEEATLLGLALGESPAHVLCLDDGMPALTKDEAKLISDLRVLPEDQRQQYAERISLLAHAYRKPVPTARVMRTGYNPKRRPKAKPKLPRDAQ